MARESNKNSLSRPFRVSIRNRVRKKTWASLVPSSLCNRRTSIWRIFQKRWIERRERIEEATSPLPSSSSVASRVFPFLSRPPRQTWRKTQPPRNHGICVHLCKESRSNVWFAVKRRKGENLSRNLVGNSYKKRWVEKRYQGHIQASTIRITKPFLPPGQLIAYYACGCGSPPPAHASTNAVRSDPIYTVQPMNVYLALF